MERRRTCCRSCVPPPTLGLLESLRNSNLPLVKRRGPRLPKKPPMSPCRGLMIADDYDSNAVVMTEEKVVPHPTVLCRSEYTCS